MTATGVSSVMDLGRGNAGSIARAGSELDIKNPIAKAMADVLAKGNCRFIASPSALNLETFGQYELALLHFRCDDTRDDPGRWGNECQ
jgi:hypothetical protein